MLSIDRSNNTGAIDVKMDGSVLEEKSCMIMIYETLWTGAGGDLLISMLEKLI